MKNNIRRFVSLTLIPLALGVDPGWVATVRAAWLAPSEPRVACDAYVQQALQAFPAAAFAPSATHAIGQHAAVVVRQTFRRVVATSLIAVLLPTPAALAKKKATPPTPTPRVAVVTTPDEPTLTPEQLEAAWTAGIDQAVDLREYRNILPRVILANPDIRAAVLDHRAERAHLTALQLGEGKTFSATSNDTHALRVTEIGKQPQVRDEMGTVGVTTARPERQVETYGLAHDKQPRALWSRIAHQALSWFLDVAGGVQVYSKSTVEKAERENDLEAVEVNLAHAHVREAAEAAAHDADAAWFAVGVRRQWVAERTAELALAEERVAHAQALERDGFGDPEAPGGSRDLALNVAAPARAALDSASHDLTAAHLHLSAATAARGTDVGHAENAALTQGPTWTFADLERAAESSSVSDHATEAAALPALAELFSDAPDHWIPAVSPKEDELETKREGLTAILVELLELQKKTTWQFGVKLQAATNPLLNFFLNWNVNKPAPSTVLSVDQLVREVQLRAKALDDAIDAERVRATTAFSDARDQFHRALGDLRQTRAQIAELRRQVVLADQDRTNYATTLDRRRVDRQRAVLEARALRQVAEALAAWKAAEAWTPEGEKVVDEALDAHEREVQDRLVSAASGTAKSGSSLKRLVPLVAAAFSIPLFGHFSSASAHTFAGSALQAAAQAVPQPPVISAVQRVAVDVVIGKYTTGTDNTLSGVAVQLLRASHERVTGSAIQTWVDRLTRLNKLPNANQIPQGPLHIGSLDADVAARLPGFHWVTSAPTASAPVSVAHEVAKTVAPVAHPAVHAAFWGDPTTWAWIVGGVVVITAIIWIARHGRTRSSRPALLTALAGGLALLGAPNVPRVTHDLKPEAIERRAESVKHDVSEAVTDNYAVSVNPYRHAVALPTVNEPGVISRVRRVRTLAPHQALVALDPLPYESLVAAVNDAWHNVHPDAAPLLDATWLASAPGAASAPIHVRTFNADNAVSGKIRAELVALRQLLIQDAYVQAAADKTRRENGETAPTLPERQIDPLIAASVERLRALAGQFRAEQIIAVGSRALAPLAGTWISVGTPVWEGGTSGVPLFEEENKAVLDLGLSWAEARAWAAAPPTAVLVFADHQEQLYRVPLRDIRAVTASGGLLRRDPGVTQAKSPALESSAFGALPTLRIQAEIPAGRLPFNSVLTFKGVFATPAAVAPFTPTVTAGDALAIISVEPPATFTVLRHAALAPGVHEEGEAIRHLLTLNQALIDDTARLLPSDNPAVLHWRQDLERRQAALEAQRAIVADQETALVTAGVPFGAQIDNGAWITPTHPLADDDASALDRKFPGPKEAEQRSVWTSTVRLRATVEAPRTFSAPRTVAVYLPALGRRVNFTLAANDNADRRFPAVYLTYEATVPLESSRGITMAELQRVFPKPSEAAVAFGDLPLGADTSVSPIEALWLRLTSAVPSFTWPSTLSLARDAWVAAWKWLLAAVGILAVVVLGRRSSQQPLAPAPRVPPTPPPPTPSTNATPQAPVPPRASRALMLDIFGALPGKLEKGLIKAPAPETALGRPRAWAKQLLKGAANRVFQHVVGMVWVYYLFVRPLKNILVREAFFRGIEGQGIIRDLVYLTPSFDQICLIVFLFTTIYISVLQRSGEVLTVPPLLVLNGLLWGVDHVLLTPPLRFIQRLSHHERARENGAELDRQRVGHFLDLAHIGRFFLAQLDDRLDTDPALASSLLAAFADYNARRLDRHRPGSGPLEILQTPGESDVVNARQTLRHAQARHSLSIRALLALVASRLVHQAYPDDDQLRYRAEFAVDAFIKSNLFPQVSRRSRHFVGEAA